MTASTLRNQPKATCLERCHDTVTRALAWETAPGPRPGVPGLSSRSIASVSASSPSALYSYGRDIADRCAEVRQVGDGEALATVVAKVCHRIEAAVKVWRRRST